MSESDRTFHPNPKVNKVLQGIHKYFYAVGFDVRPEKTSHIIHLPHLVAFPEATKEEQQQDVTNIVQDAITFSEVKDATITSISDADGRHLEGPNWFRFHVQVTVPN